MFFFEYILLLKYFILCVILSCLLVFLSMFVVFQNMDSEKLSIYECGFSPFTDSRIKFEVKFYLIAILFVIFDLELTFLLPWTLILTELSWFGFWTMVIFLGILVVGFIYEWGKGALKGI